MSNLISLEEFRARSLELAERDGCHGLSRLDRDILGLSNDISQPKTAAKQGVTVSLLDIVPNFVPDSLRSQGAKLPMRRDEALGDVRFLTRLVDHLHAAAQSHCFAELVCVTITSTAGQSVLDLVDLAAWQAHTYGGWLVIEAKASGEHIHGFILVDAQAEAQELSDAHVARHGLDPDAQQCVIERNWRTPHPRRGVFGWTRYVLAVDSYAHKRTRPEWEIPVGVFDWGCFAGAAKLSQWALGDRDTLARFHAGPTSTVTRVCECGCGDAAALGSRFANATHGARARKRREHARKRLERQQSKVSADNDKSAGRGGNSYAAELDPQSAGSRELVDCGAPAFRRGQYA